MTIAHRVMALGFVRIFDANKKGEDLEPKFQVLPFCFQASFPDPDAAGLKVSRGSERLAPDLFAVFVHCYISIISCRTW